MPKKLVSIIIPCHNSELFLSRAVRSALNQNYSKTEIILVDNNSIDNTYELCKSFEKRFPEKVRVYKETKPGAGSARNKGLKESRGEWIQFLDSDDELLPLKIEKQITIAESSQIELIIGNYLKIQGNKAQRICAASDPWIGLIRSKLGITSSILWNKRAIDRVDNFNEKWTSSEEYVLLFDILKSGGQTANAYDFNTLVYVQPDSVGKSQDPERRSRILENNLKLRCDIRDYLLSKDLFNHEISKEFEQYIYCMLVWNKYTAPQFYRKFSGQFEFNLPYLYRLRKKIGTELRRLF